MSFFWLRTELHFYNVEYNSSFWVGELFPLLSLILVTWQYFNWLIFLVGRVFAHVLEDLGSIPGHIVPKTLKMVLDTSLLNTQLYKVHGCKVEQFRERNSTLLSPWCSSYWKKGAFWSLSTRVANLLKVFSTNIPSYFFWAFCCR